MNEVYFVTGGAGFIGSNLVHHLLDETTAQVINFDKLTYAGNLESLSDIEDHPRYHFVQGDIGDRDAVSALFAKHRPTAVLHLAAESHVDRSIDAPLTFIDTNVRGTASLLVEALAYWRSLDEATRGRFRFLHVSTDEVYGSLGPTGAFTESTAYAPNSPYSASKASADFSVRAFHHTYGLPTLITNCSNNYGPRQFPEKLVPLMIQNALSGKPLPVYGNGANIRDWLFVEDHCRAIVSVLAKGRAGEVYNVGGNCEKNNLEVIHHLCHWIDQLCPELPHAPCESLITFVKDRPGHDARYAVDASKIRRELGWTPREDFDSGFRRTVEWYLSNPTWMKNVLSGNYRLERLGLDGMARAPN